MEEYKKNPRQTHYSNFTKKCIYGLAKLFGYNSLASTAILKSHMLYRPCSLQLERNRDFFINVCKLPDNFQTWFSVTHLHIWMMMVHLRTHEHGKRYMQEVVNRFFEDIEDRIIDLGINQQRLITNYIKDYIAQCHGSVQAFDEGMCKDDTVLAAALWRNVLSPSVATTATVEANNLALLVRYVRAQLQNMDQYKDVMEGHVDFAKLDTTPL
ncbi:ubiquinol-cytochrome C chaperone-domain-containing protein [Mycotypha africana]|uniref:ubiquinol-cytochrome C chaperone-domain-containing protein n=1 Tax=Mycotypha africana TaxID=64632 RepID=UPI0023000CD4|nr:ubiquinol-cytochrome C chaperone-domain-containing protein [Mycotypha africana]KAI8967636.1 ubiquinol-cytochrome C chaperone-domain-containing protein [Mycotypha africana]